MEKLTLTAGTGNMRIDAWLSAELPDRSRTYIQKLINDGMVTVGGKAVKTNHRLREGDAVEVSIPQAQQLDVIAEDIDLDVLYEDNDIIVINKPRGMVVHPAAGNYSGTLVNALLEHCKDSLSDINGIIRPGIVHRIDKDTSGVLVVAKNNSAHEKLAEKLKDHDIDRKYIAVAGGVIREDSGKVDAPIGRHPVDRKRMAVNIKNGRRAVTHFRVLERFENATLLELRLETGRTHQIRVHMSYIGHPLLGDELYRGRQIEGFEGQALHAMKLGFVHPVTAKYMEFTAVPPDSFTRLVEDLREKRQGM